MKPNYFKYSSPANFYPIIDKIIPIFALLTFISLIIGLYWSFFETPDKLSDQKEYYRIIFVHVPAAWLSMWLYLIMVFWAAIGLIFNTRLSFMTTAAIAPTGALFTFLSLVTGAIWGKTSWGTWWDWDPRMTSQLILLFLYIGYMALQSAIDDPRRSDRASALLAIVGLILVPIIYWSVNCPDPNQCAALHQQSSFKDVENNILIGMFTMTFSFCMYSFVASLKRLQSIILIREARSTWLKRLLERQL